jgi:hypothetical protein
LSFVGKSYSPKTISYTLGLREKSDTGKERHKEIKQL